MLFSKLKFKTIPEFKHISSIPSDAAHSKMNSRGKKAASTKLLTQILFGHVFGTFDSPGRF